MSAEPDLDGALVFGSLPPDGRDLDLLAPPGRERELAAALERAGFLGRGGGWARFGIPSQVVELVPAASWDLPASETEALFAEALPIPGTKLLRPAPAHRLLITARRAVREGPALDPKLAARLDEALEEDPGALAAARERARAWGAARALELTERMRSGAGRARAPARALALAEEWRARGARAPVAWPRAIRSLLPRRRRGALISLSGLDGSGKSSQAEALADTLDRLGHEAEIEWVAMQPPLWLDRVARTVKRAMKPGRGGRPRDREDPARAVRQGSPALTYLWSLAVALRLALRAGVVLRSRLWRGRTVICDRYLLDAWTYMRFHYGAARSFRLQMLLLRALAPRPAAAFLLQVPPEVASSRKDDFDPVENARRAGYYDELAEALAVRGLDGTEPPQALAATIAAAAWAAVEDR